MPTLALKSGDFSGLPAIRDPLTQTPFPNNRIPADRITGVARELLKFTSDPNSPGTGAAGLGNNFTVNVPTRESYDRATVRIDSQLTSNDKHWQVLPRRQRTFHLRRGHGHRQIRQLGRIRNGG